MGILARLLRQTGSRSLLTTVPRRDGLGSGLGYGGRWVNPMSGMGGPLDRSQSDEYTAGLPVDQWLADSLLETNAIARRIAGREAEDCTREGYDLTGLDPGLADAVEQYCEGGDTGEGLGLLGALAEARTWARAYGGGALVLLVDDGREPWEPIDQTNIRAVRGVLSADRYELPVQTWGADRNEARTYGRPQVYRLQLNRGGGASQVMRVHADRVVRLRGIPLPRRLMIRRQGWDGSIFDLVYAQLRAYGSTHVQCVEAVTLLNQGVLTTPALVDALETEEGMGAFKTRLEAMRMAMGTYGEMAIGDHETYQINNRSIAGIGDAIKAAVDALVAAADGMPRLVLLGEPTAGLSDTTGGEMRMWYDSCAAKQPAIYTPAVRRVVKLVMLSHEGPTGGRALPFNVEWRPLWQENASSQAALDLQRAQRRMVDIQANVVSPAEARRDPTVVELYELQGDQPGLQPATEPGELAEAPPEEGATVAEQALNGAQIKSLVEIVTAVAMGELPRDSALGIIGASFPLLRGREEEILGSAEAMGGGAGPLGGLASQAVEAEDDAELAAAQPSMEPPPPDLMSARDVGALFGVPTATISRLIATGELPYWGLGKHKRVSMAAVAALAKAHEAAE